MSERRDASAGNGEPQVKVVDRRRFTREGEPLEPERESGEPDAASESATAPPASGGGSQPSGEGERDATIARQAARIDELTRAYAALVEDQKAFRQRLEREKTRLVDAERAAIAQALLEAADDLERALAAAGGAAEEGGPAMKALVEGVRLSLGAVQKRIAEIGAERLSVVGERFDPRLAEAIDTVAVGDEAQDGVVVQEIRPGYRIGDRVLRPARVRVGRLARA